MSRKEKSWICTGNGKNYLHHPVQNHGSMCVYCGRSKNVSNPENFLFAWILLISIIIIVSILIRFTPICSIQYLNFLCLFIQQNLPMIKTEKLVFNYDDVKLELKSSNLVNIRGRIIKPVDKIANSVIVIRDMDVNKLFLCQTPFFNSRINGYILIINPGDKNEIYDLALNSELTIENHTDLDTCIIEIHGHIENDHKSQNILAKIRVPIRQNIDKQLISVSTPERGQPPQGKANSCKKSKYLGKFVKLSPVNKKFKQVSNVTIEVTAGTYDCNTSDSFPDLQLNLLDAQKLWGGSDLPQFQKVLVEIKGDAR